MPIMLFVFSSSIFSQAPATGSPPSTPQNTAPGVVSSSNVNQASVSQIDKLQAEVDKIKDSQKSSSSAAVITGIASFLAVLVASLLALLGQWTMGKREERRTVAASKQSLELARQEAVFKHTEKILEFRLKQMEQFYAPMFALLEQSKALYDKLLAQLVQDESGKYQMDPQVKEIPGYRLYVLAEDGKWKGFRLLDQLPEVKKNAKALALVDGIIKIGNSMTQIISDHAGLASEKIIKTLGQYLAHFALLSTIYQSSETSAYPPGWHQMGYYPRELNKMIEEGYSELSRFLDKYASASRNMLETNQILGGIQQNWGYDGNPRFKHLKLL
jgi:hypothetical protein